MIRAICVLAVLSLTTPAQTTDPAYQPLSEAYDALRTKDYDRAIPLFLKAIEKATTRADIRKDLAYTYLKAGETEAARDQFGAAMQLDPTDEHVAMEYAFLCYETKQQAEARRIFDRVRKTGNPTAEQAFQNIDRPLVEGIARWEQAVEAAPDRFSGHEELAKLAEQRDDFELAARHYEIAWKLRPDMRAFLLDLGRVWKALGRKEQSEAVLLAASRSRDSRVAESARELMPSRYPYVYEFHRAADIDPKNVELRRELAYLLLEMNKKDEAEQEFRQIVDLAPDDLLSAAQLGFLRLGRKDITGAMPLLERVMQGSDEELADRVRGALKLPQSLRRRGETPRQRAVEEAKVMAERSIEKGYLKDALKYLTIAHESDPVDFGVILKLGWTNNLLQQDRDALRWFNMARKSPDPAISTEAARAYGNLRPTFARTRTTAWLFPFYSSRWNDVFSYGQVKTEFRIGKLPVRPYLSTRFAGDTRRTVKLGEAQPALLAESAFIFGLGLSTNSWRGLMAWGEAGTSVGYIRHGARPDYRGGLSYGKGFGHLLGAEAAGVFFETNADAVFVSRFENDTLFYSQNRAGFTFAPAESMDNLQLQLFWNQNFTTDTKRQYWANALDAGPGVRFRWQSLPPAMSFSVSALRGRNYVNQGNPRSPNYYDFRAGVWYAITH